MTDPFAKETEQTAVSPEEVSVSDEEARPVKDLLQAVLKTKRAFEMYPANNPILQKFREELVRRFSDVLGEVGSMSLVVRQYDIFYKGALVYHNTEKDDNLALYFYKDGLRELTFNEGFTEDEILDFIDIIRARPEASVESYDDDIVTLLWEKDFVNLSYYVVEEFSEGTSLEQDEMERLMSKGTATDGDLEEAYQDAIEEDTEGIFSPLETISMGFKGVFSLGEEEVKSLKEEMEGLTDEYFLNKAIDVLFESLYIDRGTSGFDLLVDNLDSAFSYLIDSGNFGNAALILKRFRELGNQKDVFNEREVARITKSISGAGSVEFVKRIARVFSDGREVDENELKLFLAQLDNNAIIPLFSLASEVQDIKYRKVILESLVTLGRGRIEVLTAAVKDKRWQVARNAVAILGRIGDKAAIEALKHALTHPEPNVRREAIRSLGMIGGPKAGDALLYALDDADQQIRLSALRFLPRAQSFAVLDSLMEIASRTEFPEKPFPERRAVFEVMGEIGQERVLPFMSRLLKKKGLFSSAKKEELRACAAYGLGNIHKTEALDLLKKEVGRSKKGGPLSEAISYSVKKLDRPAG